ncbi:Metallo-dependent hydrolase [Athelia psychrophila]|uniref:adenosine deaminase n=1 Tax=Athelia psychrophila TaxID=1759441 RepID=A0A166DTE8_9AGAM|nr:Metallo-dependent hydrolase [Fibularhizoctonia sp. CBS 109695]
MSQNDIIADYQAKRAGLIQEDRALRADHARTSNRFEAEAKADAIISSIRAEEAISVWDAEQDRIPHPFPGMEFLTARDVIAGTKIFKILTKMPKGALLHSHLDATVNQHILLKLALEQPAVHIAAARPLTAANLASTQPIFKALSAAQFTQGQASLTDAAYVGESLVDVRTARETFSPELGGPAGFDDWIVGWLTINPEEAYKTHNTVTKIWQKFSSTFLTSEPLTHFVPICTISFLPKTMTNEQGEEVVEHREWLLNFEQIVNEVKAELKKEGREDDFIGAKIIYTTLRFITPAELEWYTADCLALKREFPHLIAGFDLVGDENLFKPLIDYIGPLLQFRADCKEAGLEIPFLFHAGETLGDGSKADVNLYDAILLGTKRIGHGFSLVKHPKLMQLCREKDIMIEVCPISNEILRLTSSMPMHPLPIVLNNGIPVALCSDDPAVFGNMGLSFDFYQALVASEVTGLIQLGEMARDSIKYSCMDAGEKARALAIWEKRWVAFVEAVAANVDERTSSTDRFNQHRTDGRRRDSAFYSLALGATSDPRRYRQTVFARFILDLSQFDSQRFRILTSLVITIVSPCMSQIMISASSIDVQALGDVPHPSKSRKLNHFFILKIDGNKVFESAKVPREPLQWKEQQQFHFTPSSKIDIAIYRKSRAFGWRRPVLVAEYGGRGMDFLDTVFRSR